jgi:predicted DNA-binding transcriptional regulator YafY
MEIMRHAPEVKVISPKALRDQVKKQLTAALENI